MPIYDYRCIACAHEVEVIHSIDAAGPTVCDVCGGTMRKALSAPAIHFKGSGWAKKDAQSAKKAAAKASEAKSAKSETGTDPKSKTDAESKPGDGDGAKPATDDTTSTSTAKPRAEATSGSASSVTPD